MAALEEAHPVHVTLIMPIVRSSEAIVLRSFDIGEGDRLCILLTREEGRIAARARGVRKPKSRFGSSLLPLQRVHVELRRGSAGFAVVSAECLATHDRCRRDVVAYYAAERAVETVLRMLEDEEPLPEVYRLTSDFLALCDARTSSWLLPAFLLRLYHLLGMLPSVHVSAVSGHRFTSDDAVVYSARCQGFCLHREDVSGREASARIRTFFAAATQDDFPASLPDLSSSDIAALHALVQSTTGIQLGGASGSLIPSPCGGAPVCTPT